MKSDGWLQFNFHISNKNIGAYRDKNTCNEKWKRKHVVLLHSKFYSSSTIKDKNNWTGLLTLSIFNIDKKETYTKTCYK